LAKLATAFEETAAGRGGVPRRPQGPRRAWPFSPARARASTRSWPCL